MEKLISLAQVEQLIDEMKGKRDSIFGQQELVQGLQELKSKLSSLPTEESGWIADISEIKKAIAYIDTGVIQIDRILDDGIKDNGILLEDARIIKGNISSRLGIINRWLNRLERLVGAEPLPKPPLQ